MNLFVKFDNICMDCFMAAVVLEIILDGFKFMIFTGQSFHQDGQVLFDIKRGDNKIVTFSWRKFSLLTA